MTVPETAGLAVPEFPTRELAQVLSGEWLHSPPEVLRGVFTDTRKPVPGAWFVALVGENFDAHNLLDQAIAAGAGALLIQREYARRVPQGVPALLVADTLSAYRELGAWWRRQCPDLTVLGVTGSVGKTSVKEMIRAIFQQVAPERVVWTQGNTNNQIGVPQNLLRLKRDTRFAVIEMGSNHFGEIAPLTRIAAPQIALINSIAPCHLEFFGDLDGVAREKATIFDGVQPGGVAVIPHVSAGNAYLRSYAKSKQLRVVTFGAADSGADYTATYLGGDLSGSRFKLTFPSGETREVHWTLSGAHQALNAAGAAAVAGAYGLSCDVIAAGLAQTTLPGQRQKVTVLNGVTYCNDAYNASPQSMKAALRMLKEFAEPKKLILLLGQMGELGTYTAKAHQEVLDLAAELFPESRKILIGANFPGGLPDYQAAAEVLQKQVQPGDLVYAKGSFSVKVFNALPPEAR